MVVEVRWGLGEKERLVAQVGGAEPAPCTSVSRCNNGVLQKLVPALFVRKSMRKEDHRGGGDCLA